MASEENIKASNREQFTREHAGKQPFTRAVTSASASDSTALRFTEIDRLSQQLDQRVQILNSKLAAAEGNLDSKMQNLSSDLRRVSPMSDIHGSSPQTYNRGLWIADDG